MNIYLINKLFKPHTLFDMGFRIIWFWLSQNMEKMPLLVVNFVPLLTLSKTNGQDDSVFLCVHIPIAIEEC